ncbi:hypothetical protein DFH07DRAFT_62250 [Mycena maculata]|uniref:Uncharacterized protein n=1 Tax=Mycena maculata TaxID=230809 RepID=A0AAD7N122_9AGAR|nr:hypothetical protein DFH07DRAFT_62250 [Mycena maculata]
MISNGNDRTKRMVRLCGWDANASGARRVVGGVQAAQIRIDTYYNMKKSVQVRGNRKFVNRHASALRGARQRRASRVAHRARRRTQPPTRPRAAYPLPLNGTYDAVAVALPSETPPVAPPVRFAPFARMGRDVSVNAHLLDVQRHLPVTGSQNGVEQFVARLCAGGDLLHPRDSTKMHNTPFCCTYAQSRNVLIVELDGFTPG